ELEAEDRPGDDADGEEREHHLRPAAGEQPVEGIARPQMKPLDEENERRERDPEADERNVRCEGQRLHLARLEQVLLVYRSEDADAGDRGVEHRRIISLPAVARESRRREDAIAVEDRHRLVAAEA